MFFQIEVIHFTFITPLVLLTILMIRALTLTGVTEMLQKIYELTDWQRLAEYNVGFCYFFSLYTKWFKAMNMYFPSLLKEIEFVY